MIANSRGVVALAFLAALLPVMRVRAQAAVPVSPASVGRIAQHDSSTTSYEVGGIRVIHRLTPANDVVAANVYLLGGVRQVTPETAGIETLLLQASELGTQDYSKERLRRVINRLGSTIVVDPDADWTTFGLRATRSTFDSTWMVLASRLMAPKLDSADVELVRTQILAGVRQRGDSPDALVSFVADSFAFAGHPYATSTSGTETSMTGITLSMLRTYQAQQIVKSRLLVVVVGSVPRSSIERLLTRTFAKLPVGSFSWTLPDTLPTRAAGFVIEPRSLPTNYILGYYAGPPAGSRDYQALRVATAVLSGQLFAEIRSRRNLTYAVDAPFIERAVSAGGLYVTTVSPDTTLALMRAQISALQEGTIDPEALGRLVQQFITEYFLNNETNAEQADFLARAQLFRGDYHAGERFVDELRDVTPDDVRRVARRYMRNVRFGYVGDAKRLSSRTLRSF